MIGIIKQELEENHLIRTEIDWLIELLFIKIHFDWFWINNWVKMKNELNNFFDNNNEQIQIDG